MTLVLPSTVEELNQLQQSFETYSKSSSHRGFANKDFDNITVEKQYKREVSLPNGLENWNISNFDSYLNFEENFDFKAIESGEDRLVPEDGNFRSDSFSSTSSMESSSKRIMFPGVMTFNTVCADSGSTCITSDHNYPDSMFRGFDAEETYQNLDLFLQQVPEIAVTDSLPSPLSTAESSFELLQGSFSLEGNSQDSSLLEAPRGTKRPASTSSDEDFFGMTSNKHLCSSPPQYTEVRRKNNISSKNCRKTRKEKQKEMEVRVSQLEKEKESLRVEVQVLEELIQAHKMQLYAILQKR